MRLLFTVVVLFVSTCFTEGMLLRFTVLKIDFSHIGTLKLIFQFVEITQHIYANKLIVDKMYLKENAVKHVQVRSEENTLFVTGKTRKLKADSAQRTKFISTLHISFSYSYEQTNKQTC